MRLFDSRPDSILIAFGNVFSDRFDPIRNVLVCTNETVVQEALDYLECEHTPLCGFATWQTACRAVQLSSATLAMSTFNLTFMPHCAIMFMAFLLHGDGRPVVHRDEATSLKLQDRDYSRMLSRHMLVAILGIAWTNVLMLYQLVRFLFLVAFLVSPMPITDDTRTIDLPGACYGECGALYA